MRLQLAFRRHLSSSLEFPQLSTEAAVLARTNNHLSNCKGDIIGILARILEAKVAILQEASKGQDVHVGRRILR